MCNPAESQKASIFHPAVHAMRTKLMGTQFCFSLSRSYILLYLKQKEKKTQYNNINISDKIGLKY
jgi:hypothetical protein